jgi:hypothetical protein
MTTAWAEQEWYKEERHAVLLENFPVRGAFSQVSRGRVCH